MGKRDQAEVTVSGELDGDALTLGDIRQLVGWCEALPDDSTVHAVTFVQWSANPAVRTLTVKVPKPAK